MRISLAIVAMAGMWWTAVAASAPVTPLQVSPRPRRTAPPSPPTVALSTAQIQPGVALTVTGRGFGPGRTETLFLDTPDHPLSPPFLTSANGSFAVQVSAPDGAAVGAHQICAPTAAGSTCAELEIVAAAGNPSPTGEPTAEASAVPTDTPSDTSISSPTAGSASPATVPAASTSALSGLFPLILAPAALLLGLAGLALWLLRRGRTSKTSADGSGAGNSGAWDAEGPNAPVVTHRLSSPLSRPLSRPSPDPTPKRQPTEAAVAPAQLEQSEADSSAPTSDPPAETATAVSRRGVEGHADAEESDG